jgi:hypothetical protein
VSQNYFEEVYNESQNLRGAMIKNIEEVYRDFGKYSSDYVGTDLDSFF